MIDITQWRIAIGTHHLRWRRNSNYGLTTLGEYHIAAVAIKPITLQLYRSTDGYNSSANVNVMS